MNKMSEAIRFLDDSLFFEQHMGSKLNAWSNPRATTQPLIEVRHTESHDWVRNTFVPWLSGCSKIAQHDLGELATCLSELFNNIDDHTEFDVGSVFAQWYPQEERVIVAVADFGVGIPTTVGRVCEGLSDSEAIIKAFEDEFTSQSTPRNRGIGLHFLLQNVVQNLSGKLEVNSANGAVVFEKVGNLLNAVPYTQNGYCPGTLIVLEFNTSAIERTDGDLEDLEW
ncbi:ATP-binding protein [Ruegeria atlantica]|nr:ATP-binding protein [Ruegeria atlantica]